MNSKLPRMTNVVKTALRPVAPSLASLVGCCALIAANAAHAQNFVHFESPQVHPLELTPDGARLIAVNTVDARIEVFDVLASAPYLSHVASIGVGLEPVSVRARTNSELWVVNHVSDSVSIVDLASMSVTATLLTGDEPCDVVFAGSRPRAFVSCSQLNRVEVYTPTNLAAAPTIVNIAGEDPRALATDGTRVYALIAECGNDTTAISATKVSTAANPYPGDPNPPPNTSSGFSPALTPGLPVAPKVSQIVRKDAAGAWRDNNGVDWSALVTWNLNGNDMAVINANTLATTYAKGQMTSPMAITLAPDGRVVTVGTEAKNEVRFEPNLKGTFVHVEAAVMPAGGATTSSRGDINPHLSYAQSNIPVLQRMLSIGDPRGVVVSADGTRAYATGLGSSNLIAFSLANYARLGQCDVGEGPTGIALDATHARIFTLNRFAGTISVVSEPKLVPLAEVAFFDPTPAVVKNGRPFVFDTHLASGLGQVSCASCHVDARMDQLAWDLGDPSGTVKTLDQQCNLGLPLGGSCGNWHPMKGPMTTQTLVGLANHAPFHWRGDRGSLAEFGHAASSLLGGDADFTGTEMNRFEAYLATISFPPNPNRNLDGSLKTSLAGGNPVTGQTLFNTGNLDVVQCATCHVPANGGSNASLISGSLLQEAQSMKVPHLRNMYEKTGFDSATGATNNRGFGFTHDGADATLFDFFKLPVFNFAAGATGDQQRRDVSAFMLSFDTGTHASVGAQATMGGAASNGSTRRNQLVTIANAGSSQLVARAVIAGVERGFLYQGGVFQSDVAGSNFTVADLDALASAGTAVTYTLVPNGTGLRAIDRDGDGFRDGDERAVCSDPANPASIPGGTCRFDIAGGNQTIDGQDLAVLLGAWGGSGAGDLDCDGVIGAADLAIMLNAWGACH